MGNVCCGNDESKKSSAFEESATDHESLLTATTTGSGLQGHQNGHTQPQQQHSQAAVPNSSSATPVLSQQEAERQQELLLEQARLEVIVQTAGRSMVAINKGNLPYYNDQGFASALTEHLEATTSFPQHISPMLPAISNSGGGKEESVYARLSQGLEHGWDERRLDQTAESALDAILVSKERLFAGVQPVVENLI